jgi:hypothetical protein
VKGFRSALGYLAAGLVGLIIGFFAGREYLKYEIRTAFQSAFGDIQKSLSSFVGDLGKSPAAASARPSLAASPGPPPAAKSTEPSPIAVALISKGFKTGRIEDEITLELSVRNLGKRDIRAFEGTLRFTDLLDNTNPERRLGDQRSAPRRRDRHFATQHKL